MAKPACTLFHQKLVRAERTQNCLWRGSERRRFTHLRLELNDSKTSTLENDFKSMRLRCAKYNSLILFELTEGRFVYIYIYIYIYKMGFQKYPDLCVCHHLTRFSLPFYFHNSFYNQGCPQERELTVWYPFTVVHGSFRNTLYLFLPPVPREKKRGYGFIPNC